jgi:hypothetical protein
MVKPGILGTKSDYLLKNGPERGPEAPEIRFFEPKWLPEAKNDLYFLFFTHIMFFVLSVAILYVFIESVVYSDLKPHFETKISPFEPHPA